MLGLKWPQTCQARSAGAIYLRGAFETVAKRTRLLLLTGQVEKRAIAVRSYLKKTEAERCRDL